MRESLFCSFNKARHKDSLGRKSVLPISIVITLFPSIAYAQSAWTGNIAYALIMLLPVLIARTVASASHKKRILIIGIVLVFVCMIIVSLDTGIVIFYIVTSLPLILIVVAVYLRRSHLHKNLKIEDIQ